MNEYVTIFKIIEMHIPYIVVRQTDRLDEKMDEDVNISVLKYSTRENLKFSNVSKNGLSFRQATCQSKPRLVYDIHEAI